MFSIKITNISCDKCVLTMEQTVWFCFVIISLEFEIFINVEIDLLMDFDTPDGFHRYTNKWVSQRDNNIIVFL